MTKNELKIYAQVVAETVAETKGAPCGVLYVGLQKAGLPHGSEGLEMWSIIERLLVSVGYVKVQNHFMTPTEKLLADVSAAKN